MVIVPQNSSLLVNSAFLHELDESSPIAAPVQPTIAYGQPPKTAGFHVMETPST